MIPGRPWIGPGGVVHRSEHWPCHIGAGHAPRRVRPCRPHRAPGFKCGLHRPLVTLREHGARRPRADTHVVLVHGFPDDQRMWEPVVEALPLDELHVVTYDVRGAGRSSKPEGRGATAPSCSSTTWSPCSTRPAARGRAGAPRRPRLGLDRQLWDAVAAETRDPRLHGRLASYTSISGPTLDHLAGLVRRPRGRRRAVLRQLLHSWYVYLFLVPRVPELVWRRGHRVLGAGDGPARGAGPRPLGAGPGRRRRARRQPLPRQRRAAGCAGPDRCTPTCRSRWCTRGATPT